MPAEPTEPWLGVRDAFEDPPICPQGDPRWGEQDEDCLYVNIYIKKPPDEIPKLKPVLVYIHGGGLIIGTGNSKKYGPDNLMAHDVILVFINYRLGLLGFLQLNDPAVNVFGNNGLKDQVLALKWIQKNIAKFGGNPNQVTLAGQSSGGMAVHAHTLSPLSKGLFQQCIIKSSVVTYMNLTSNNSFFINFLNRKLNWKTDTEKEIFDIFNASSWQDLNSAVTNYTYRGYDAVGLVVESPLSPAPFMPHSPWDALSQNYFHDTPCIIGFSSSEGMELTGLYSNDTNLWFSMQMFNFNMKLRKYNLTNAETNFYKKKILDFYTTRSNDSTNNFIELQSDLQFLVPLYDTIELQFRKYKSPVFVSMFDFDTEINYAKKIRNLKFKGTSHGDELGYIFSHYFYPKSPKLQMCPNCQLGIDYLTTFWTNFATTGNPNKPNTRFDTIWKPLEKMSNQINHLVIGPQLRMKKDVQRDGLNLWKKLREN